MAHEASGLRSVLIPLVISVFALTADLRGQETLGWYRFEEGVGGEGEEVVDDETGDAHGTVLGLAFFVPDAAPIVGGPPNDASMDFTQGGSLAMDGSTFIFHDFAFGGAVGDGTLEWFMKAPGPTPPGHSALFWTGPFESRFHIYWDAGTAPGGDQIVSGDWRHGGPALTFMVASHESGVPLELDLWHSVAIVRTALGGENEYRWEWYFNGELRVPRTVETIAPLPGGLDWTVNGRGGFRFPGFMDEIRLTDGIPDDFLLVDRGCPAPDAGDTHCTSLTVEGEGQERTATVQASDDSGDPILYTITADDGAGRMIERTPADGRAVFSLAEGTWTISASVDDDILCIDSAADRACDPVVVEVDVAPPLPSTLWYRFENQGGNSGIDVPEETTGLIHGSVSTNEMFVDDVAKMEVDGTPVANVGSLDFRNGDRLNMDGAPPFVFHDVLFGGAEGDATLEFLIKPPSGGGGGSPGHSALFWTGGQQPLNLVHIYWNAAPVTGAEGASQFITGDWHRPGSGSTFIAKHDGGFPLQLDLWHHVAVIRTAIGGLDEWRWEWYYDGQLNEPQTEETLGAPLPNHDGVWTLNGRGAPFHFNGLIDEVRMTFDRALEEDEFIQIEHACPVDEEDPERGDTHCLSVEIAGPADNGPGTYTATIEGSDDTDDEITYTVTADNGVGGIVEEDAEEGEVKFLLTEGSWTVTASVDDNPLCGDAADDMSCDPVFVDVEPCPTAGDTHCQNLEIIGPREGGAEGTPGTYRLSVTGVDDSGDTNLIYTFSIEDDLLGRETVGPQSEPEATFFLYPGIWSFQVLIDDDVVCDDEALNATCAFSDFEVEGDLPPPQFYLRFEEEEASTDVIDDFTDAVVGQLIDGAARSFDTPGPVPLTGAANDFSVSFSAGGSVVVDSLGFVFHDESVRGSPGDATLEFYLFTEFVANHSALFWTGPGGIAANRTHIYWGADFTGAPDSNRFVVGDWIRPGNGLTNIAVLDSGVPLEIGQWNHVAIVRTALGGGSDYRWEWYFNGERNDAQTAETLAPLPDPTEAWTINGRGEPFHFPGSLDEIRGVSEALTPESFLIGDGGGCVPDEPDGEVACEDGVDNDCDGLTDTADTDCQCVPTEETETMCEDGVDNDCDTLTDAADADCQCVPTEETETMCEDGVDNDCDTLTDADDADCVVPVGVGPFVRGDCDGNGSVGGSPTEAIIGLNFSFRGGPAPPCLAACDAEANGTLGITDYLRILRHSFLGQGEPDPPFPDCVKSDLGSDVELGCEQPVVCP